MLTTLVPSLKRTDKNSRRKRGNGTENDSSRVSKPTFGGNDVPAFCFLSRLHAGLTKTREKRDNQIKEEAPFSGNLCLVFPMSDLVVRQTETKLFFFFNCCF